MPDDIRPLHETCYIFALTISMETSPNRARLSPLATPDWFTPPDYLRAALAFTRRITTGKVVRLNDNARLCVEVAHAAIDNALSAELGGSPGLRDQYLTAAGRELQTALERLDPAPAPSAIASPGHGGAGQDTTGDDDAAHD